MQSNSGTPGDDRLSTTEHRRLGDVIDLVTRLDELRARGLTSAQMAERIRLTHPEVPGGGQWSAHTVERILKLMDGNRPVEAPSMASQAPPHAVPMPTISSATAVSPPGPGGPPRSTSDVRPERAQMRVHHQRPGEIAQKSGKRRRSLVVPMLVLAALLAATALGAAAYQGNWLDRFGVSGADSGLSAQFEDDESSDQSAGPSDAEEPQQDAQEEIASEPETDEGDRLTIVIEPSAPETGGVAPASAIIRNDGKLYVEGAFRSEGEAERFISDAADVFGTEAIVRDYVIDPAAPDPQVSDIALEKPVLFESGSAEIDPEYIPFLEACGDVLKLNPQIVMSITAITDSVGDEEFNLELSVARANAIVAFYQSMDVDENQLLAVGLGESKPIADNLTEEGRRANRRAMLELLNVISST